MPRKGFEVNVGDKFHKLTVTKILGTETIGKMSRGNLQKNK